MTQATRSALHDRRTSIDTCASRKPANPSFSSARNMRKALLFSAISAPRAARTPRLMTRDARFRHGECSRRCGLP
ncbi:MAG: hypothetical protein AW07_03877 [Candidatus Accumulibacter sp. SK-11]|nr:MAG: hypothetical protein AW07_03877 [Candidatus Accumulibacter sp. SK-11]